MNDQITTIDFFEQLEMLHVLYENINKLKFTQEKTKNILNNIGRSEVVLTASSEDDTKTNYTRVFNMYYVDGSVLSFLLKDFNPTTNDYNKKTITVSYKDPTNCQPNTHNHQTNTTKEINDKLSSIERVSYYGAFTGTIVLFICGYIFSRCR